MTKSQSRVATHLCRLISLAPLWPVLFSLNLRPAEAGSATWKILPFSGDWNTATNWTPTTVPNGPNDIARFGASSTTNIALSASTQMNSIVFYPNAGAYTIAANGASGLTIGGAGITNNSSVTQTFVASGSLTDFGIIQFNNGSTAGSGTFYDLKGLSATNHVYDGGVYFTGNSTAGNAVFLSEGASLVGGNNHAGVIFFDTSTPANASFTLKGGTATFAVGGAVWFYWNASGSITGNYVVNGGAGSYASGGDLEFIYGSLTNFDGSILLTGGTTSQSYGGGLSFYPITGCAFNGTITVNGGVANGAGGGEAYMQPAGALTGNGAFKVTGGAVSGAGGGFMSCANVDSGNRTFLVTGGNGASAGGGTLDFINTPGVNGQLIAEGGTNQGAGALIRVGTSLSGAIPSMKALGNGTIDVSGWSSGANAASSIQGDGVISLGGYNLTVGSGNTSTTFTGLLQDGGTFGGSGASIVKVGSGTLNLSGINTYTGGTYVTAGRLLVSNVFGSATGTGPVTVSTSTLGGNGTISGPVTVGNNSGPHAFLDPLVAGANLTGVLRLGPLVLNHNAVVKWQVNSNAGAADLVVADAITINPGASIILSDMGATALPLGTSFSVMSSNITPITGTFGNLSNGSTVTIGSNNYLVSYSGGAGNDLTLTVTP